MARKQNREIIKLVSTADTGYFYTTTRRKNKDKVQTKKYDPKVQKHVLFKEGKMK